MDRMEEDALIGNFLQSKNFNHPKVFRQSHELPSKWIFKAFPKPASDENKLFCVSIKRKKIIFLSRKCRLNLKFLFPDE